MEEINNIEAEILTTKYLECENILKKICFKDLLCGNINLESEMFLNKSFEIFNMESEDLRKFMNELINYVKKIKDYGK